MPKASSSILKRDTDSKSEEKAQVRISYKLNERLKYYEVTFSCIHGGKNFKSRGIWVRESICLLGFIHVFIKTLQIKTWRKFELRLSTSVHLLENLNQFQKYWY